MDAIQGNFGGSGFVSGLISSLIATGIQGLGELGGAFQSIDASQGIGILTNFGDRNSDLLKAVMIASGGLSGGISATIAGGKFIDGFKQGLITSGLNHVAHMVSAEITGIINSRDSLREQGVDPDQVAPSDQTTIDKLKSNRILSPLFEKAGNPGVKFEEMKGGVQGRTVNDYYNKTSSLSLNSKVQHTYYKLFSYLGHELIHVIDVVSGTSLNLYNQFVSEGYSAGNAQFKMEKWMEMNAYQWNMNNTPTSTFYYKLNQNTMLFNGVQK
ncbi:hypothetical protein [Daejeonia sp. YH14]|uniref:hypothetical protein n=1 Tax=Daejeonia sp. YH14 TaxID=3439042 RepID=UPI003F4972F1